MQIKTITFRLEYAESFDKDVNEALEYGWILKTRKILPGGQLTATYYRHTMLYAELEKPDPVEVDPVEVDHVEG